jgi:hypothetical protein
MMQAGSFCMQWRSCMVHHLDKVLIMDISASHRYYLCFLWNLRGWGPLALHYKKRKNDPVFQLIRETGPKDYTRHG